jgi:DNA-binding response OmpR family regulator
MDGRIGTSILILEDEPLIALDHGVHAEQAGFTNVTVHTSCEAASEWLRSYTPAVALLDIRLRDGPCTDIASTLTSRGVPFVVCSGSAIENVDPVFLGGIWLNKPCAPDDLIDALAEAKAKLARQAREA